MEIIKRELPVDLVQFSCMTPLPGSEDHQRLYQAGARMDPDLNKYDIEHVTTDHPLMTSAQWRQAYRDAWAAFYSPDHFETVMRRAEATNSGPGKVLTQLHWSYCSVMLENESTYVAASGLIEMVCIPAAELRRCLPFPSESTR